MTTSRPETTECGWLWGLARELGFRPLVLMAMGLVLGIVLADRLELPYSLSLLVLCLALVALAALLSHLTGAGRLLLLIVFFSVGLLLHSLHSLLPAHHLAHLLPLKDTYLVARLCEPPRQLRWGQRLVVEVEEISSQSGRQSTTGRAVLFWGHQQPTLHAGDWLRLQVASLRSLPPALNPGQFDARKFYARRGLHAQGRVSALEVIGGPRATRMWLTEFVHQRQRQALETFDQAMLAPQSEYYAGLMAGMVFGYRAAGGIDEQTEDLFRETGTIHLLVVSGAQITFIIFAIILLVTGLGRRALAPWHLLIIVPSMVAFALFSGLEASVSRALVMAALLAYALVTHRQYEVYSALALAVLALALADTQVVFDVGARLTFAASLGVILFVPRATTDPLTNRSRRPHLLALVFWGTVGAWALTAPILVNTFHGLAVLGNLANLIALPLSMVILPLGMIALLTGSWAMPVTIGLCWICRLLIKLMMWSNQLFHALPGTYVDLVYFGPVLTLAWYLLVAGGLLLIARKDLRPTVLSWVRSRKRDHLFLIGGGLAAVVIILLALHLGQPPRLTVSVLAVGEGQCVMIEGPRGPAILFDVGSNSALSGESLADDLVVPFLARQRLRRLQAVIISHPHADHCNGLARLVRRVEIGQVFDPLIPFDSATYQDLREVLAEEGLPPIRARAGQQIDLGDGATALLLAPAEPLLQGTASDVNNNSVALLLRYGTTQILLLADQEEAGLKRILAWAQARGISLQSGAVLLPHHGRSAKYCGPLLRRARPQWCMVSGARGEIAKRELGWPERIIYTEQSGTIWLYTNGRQLRLRTYRP